MLIRQETLAIRLQDLVPSIEFRQSNTILERESSAFPATSVGMGGFCVANACIDNATLERPRRSLRT